jgi:hypothetical protein
MKKIFKILDQKPLHTFSTQVKLVLTCCILQNWILRQSVEEFFLNENDVTTDHVDAIHGVGATLVRPEGIGGRSGLALCWLTEATSGSEEEEVKN